MGQEVYILSACRTPIGSFQGAFETFPASALGSIVIKEALSRANINVNDVSEVIMGQVLTAGQGQNPARQAALGAEIPTSVPAYTVNMLCGSGLKSIFLGYQAIRNADSEIIVCGGQENMSLAEHTSYLRKGSKYGNVNFKDSILQDGLIDAVLKIHMGITAEHVAKVHSINRETQDKFAVESQKKAELALDQQLFKDEIVPVVNEKTKTVISIDEYPKKGTTLEKLGKLRPCFVTDGSGTVTPGNASGINDGAAAVVIGSGTVVKDKDLKPLAKLVAFTQVACDPICMGTAPILAVQKLLQKASWSKEDVDLFELNEAFAAQSVAVVESLGLDKEKVNITGGAIALGHPIGCSGARVLVTLVHSLKRLGKKRGVASLCVGGGMGIAVAVEMC